MNMGDKRVPEGNVEKESKIPHFNPFSSPVGYGDRNADNSISDTNTVQGSEAPFMSTQDGRNLLTTDVDVRGRRSQGATTAPNLVFGGGNLPPYNPRPATNAVQDLPPLGEVLNTITRDVENRGLPPIEYAVDGNTQHLNNMSRLLRPFAGVLVATGSWGMAILPPLYAVLENIANDIENRIGGFPPIVVPANSNLGHLLNMAASFPPFSPERGPITNYSSGTGSNSAGAPSSPRILREHFIIHGRSITPNLSNSLLNQPLDNGNQFESVENFIKVEEIESQVGKGKN